MKLQNKMGYTGYQRNPDGTYICGSAYTGYQKNPDGTYICATH
ncbi:hypothetical protein [Photobacterium carnosum]|nr:hypothetical protein [Photobacterium carnosum]